MDKRKLHHTWRKFHTVRASYFLIGAVLFFLLGVYCLRQNNLTALRLRDVVVQADKDSKNVEEPLRDLRAYVYSHMNADLSNGSGVQYPVQLKYRYERLVIAEKAKTEAANGTVYTEAQAECERRFPAGASGAGRIPCIEEFVSSRGVKQTVIPDSLYKFDFISPRWSPDVAGLSLALSAVLLVLSIVRFTVERWFKHTLKQHR